MRILAALMTLFLATGVAAQELTPQEALMLRSQLFDQKSRAHTLEIENAKLRAQLANVQAKFDSARLTARQEELSREQRALTEEWRSQIGASAEAVPHYGDDAKTPEREWVTFLEPDP